jgi:hypothetical protein
MSSIDVEIYDAFRSIGVEEKKAMEAPAAFGNRDATISKALQDQKDAIARLAADVLVLKWSQGFMTALLFIIVGKLFIH